jgi:DNA-binding CsgD family transcriptional regulator
MKDLVWDHKMLGAFKALAILTEEEELVLGYWLHGKTVVATALACHMSERKVDYIRQSIREKYDHVRWCAPELPPRRIRQKKNPSP